MPKIVINTGFGKFNLPKKALAEYNRQTYGFREPVEYDWSIDRDDPILVDMVEAMGLDTNGWLADLKVVEVPDGVKWHIQEYDGAEWVAEDHRTWS